MSKTVKSSSPATQDEIAKYAYYLWESEGRPASRDLEYWLQAEAHLNAYRRFDADSQAEKPAPTPVAGTLTPTESSKPSVQAEPVRPARKRAVAIPRTSTPPSAQAVFA